MKKTILVVDDDDSVRESLRRVLEKAGYDVVLAAGPLEATGRFDPEQTDLLLLDLNLPDQSGWDVFERLTTRNPLIPVIVITGMPDQYHTALAAGVGALFEKPVEVPALLKTMQELLAEPNDVRLSRLCGRLDDTRYALPARMPCGGESRKARGWPPGASCHDREAGTESHTVMKTRTTTPTKGGVLLLAADADLRQSVRTILEAEHYHVFPATHRDEAGERLEAGSIHILVVDADHQSGSLGMLLDQWTGQCPKLRIIGLRGARTVPNVAPVDVWIEKPIRPSRLVAAVDILVAALHSEAFRDQLRQREAAPLLVNAVPYRHWGLNE